MMDSMIVINDVIILLVLCLVIFMDKMEIIKIVEDIDIYDLLIMLFEDCCMIFVLLVFKMYLKLDCLWFYEEWIDVEGLMVCVLVGVKMIEIKLGENYLNI